MPYIPVLTRDCESEQDKFLYDIWQVLAFGVSPIPPIIPGLPLGWDVNNTTNQLLYNILLALGGLGPPGVGTVTSVGSISDSLRITSSFNPIITAGDIGFELQVIEILRADLITAISGTALLPGVLYYVSDPQTPLDAMYVQALSDSVLDANMTGIIGTDFVEVSWDHGSDSLTRIHCPRKNNTTVRWAGSTYNCIEDFDTTSFRFRNCYLESCNYAGDGTEHIDGLRVLNDSNFSALDTANVDSVLVEEGSTVIIDGVNVFMGKFGGRCDLTIIDSFGTGFDYDVIQCYIQATLTFDRPFQRQSYLPYLQDSQLFVPVEGDAETIEDSKSNIIAVNLNPAAALSVWQLTTPVVPMDRQILMIDSTKEITTFQLVTGSTAAIVDAATTLVPGNGGLKYQYDLADDSWYQI